jgi:hypothetical protein
MLEVMLVVTPKTGVSIMQLNIKARVRAFIGFNPVVPGSNRQKTVLQSNQSSTLVAQIRSWHGRNLVRNIFLNLALCSIALARPALRVLR